MKRIIILAIILAMLVPSIAYGLDYIRVEDMRLIGQGVKNWDKGITRAELATIAVRLNSMEDFALLYKDSDNIFKDVKGWATGYINLANQIGIMKGTSKNTFQPNKGVSYVELLTVIMRTLGYEDKIDFIVYPDDYYQKALEIGLANVYIEPNELITRGTVAETLETALDIQIKDSKITLMDKLSNKSYSFKPGEIKEDTQKITIENIKFNTNIAALFTGTVKGREDFSGYKLILSSKNNSFTKSIMLEKDGKFSIDNFNIDVLTRLAGYNVKVVDLNGKIVYDKDLE